MMKRKNSFNTLLANKHVRQWYVELALEVQ
jgi:hypothetical protein